MPAPPLAPITPTPAPPGLTTSLFDPALFDPVLFDVEGDGLVEVDAPPPGTPSAVAAPGAAVPSAVAAPAATTLVPAGVPPLAPLS